MTLDVLLRSFYYKIIFRKDGNKYEISDETGCIKPCGREMTQRLIQAALSIEPCGEFGDLQTGYMNVESIKKIRNTINTIE